MRTSSTESGSRRRGVAGILPLIAMLMVPAAVVSTANPTAAGGGGTFAATLDASQIVPLPPASTATGTGTVILDATETTITVELVFSGLVGTTASARLQGPAAPGVNGPVVINLSGLGFPIGVMAGTYQSGPLAITPGQVSDLKAGLLYLVIGTSFAIAGEIRGQLPGVVTPPTNGPPTTATPTLAAEPVPASARFTG